MTDTPDDRFSAALRTINFEWAALKAATTEKLEKMQATERRLAEGLDWFAAQSLVLYPFGEGWRVVKADGSVLGFGETPIAAIIAARSQTAGVPG